MWERARQLCPFALQFLAMFLSLILVLFLILALGVGLVLVRNFVRVQQWKNEYPTLSPSPFVGGFLPMAQQIRRSHKVIEHRIKSLKELGPIHQVIYPFGMSRVISIGVADWADYIMKQNLPKGPSVTSE